MMERTFLNPATNKQWRIELDGHTIRTCLNGGKVKEILCDSAFQVKSKAASARCRCWAGAVPSVCRKGQQRLHASGNISREG